MPGHQVPIFAVAIGLSVLFHAGLYTGARNVPVHALGGGGWGDGRSLRIGLLSSGDVRDDSEALVNSLSTPATPTVEPESTDEAPLPNEPKPLPEPEPPAPPEPEVDKFPDRIGLYDGTGIGSHKADGDKEMKARLADNDQPFLSRDPRGAGRVGDPSPSVLPPGQNGQGGAKGGGAPDAAVVLQPSPPKPMPKFPDAEVGQFRAGPIEVVIPTSDDGVSTDAEKIDPAVADRGPLQPAKEGIDPDAIEQGPADGGMSETARLDKPFRQTLEIPLPPPARPAMSPPPAPQTLRVPPVVIAPLVPETPAVVSQTPANEQVQIGEANAGRPGPPMPAADAAQESESEVDPFSKIEAVILRDGRVDPQFGREVKTVRPKIPIVGLIDAATGARRVTLKVRVGVDGKVTSVDVFKSSGSNEIDQPCLIAMYDWWFEPLKDKRGRPIPDTVLFTLNFR